MSSARSLWVWVHRYVGLAMALFLVIVGLTGSLLAFYPELQRMANPHWFVDADPSRRLAPGELAARIEATEPQIRVRRVEVQSFEGATRVWISPKTNLATGEPFELSYDYLVVDPVTGDIFDRRRWAAISQTWRQIMDFIYELHYSLSLGMFGVWVLGIVALVWTFDNFIGAYLTFPKGKGRLGFWSRWKKAWQIKRGAGIYRLNFDMHRAGGLWVWAMLLIFAWSSVYMNLWDTVYTWTTRSVLDFRPPWVLEVPAPEPLEQSPLGWRDAQVIASQLMEAQAKEHHFRIDRPITFSFNAESASYTYEVQSSLDINDRPRRYGAQVNFDARTGQLNHVLLPRNQYAGNTVSNWLYALHMGNVFGLPYRIFVCILGLIITMLSITGVYIWWKKRQARRISQSNIGSH